MKVSYLRAIWFALALSVITTVTVVAVIYDLILVTSYPLLYTVILSAVTLAISLALRRYFTLHVLRRFGILGGLLISPALLFITSLPAALIYLITKVNGNIVDNHLVALALHFQQ